MGERKSRFVVEGGVGEIEEKKSRFIATVQPVRTEEEALAFLAAKKKEYWDAKHNCHAFVIGEDKKLQRCSDDGEPSGTAGRPMLEVLLHEELIDTAVVVTRYFGGTLLGTGGLVRAYQGAVQAGLAASKIAERLLGREVRIVTDYTDLSRIQRMIAEADLPTTNSDYGERAILSVMVPEEEYPAFTAALTDATNGRAELSANGLIGYAVTDQTVLRFT